MFAGMRLNSIQYNNWGRQHHRFYITMQRVGSKTTPFLLRDRIKFDFKVRQIKLCAQQILQFRHSFRDYTILNPFVAANRVSSKITSHVDRHIVLKGGICHFTEWQIPPFNTNAK